MKFSFTLISCVLLSAFSFSLSAYIGPKTPLMVAAEKGDLAQIKMLLAQGVDINESTDFEFLRTPGESALAFAVRNKQYDAVRLLIESGANVNRWMECGKECPVSLEIRAPTILGYAVAIKAPLEIIKKFIQVRADVNLKGVWGGNVTPLVIAEMVGYTEAIELLIKAGAIQFPQPPTFFQEVKSAAKEYKLCTFGMFAGAATALVSYFKQSNYGQDAKVPKKWLDDFAGADRLVDDAIGQTLSDKLLLTGHLCCKISQYSLMRNLEQNSPVSLQELFKEKGRDISLDVAQAFINKYKEFATQYFTAQESLASLTQSGRSRETETSTYNSLLTLQKRWRFALVGGIVLATGSVAWAIYKARSKKEEAGNA